MGTDSVRAANAEAALSASPTAPVVAALSGNDQPRDWIAGAFTVRTYGGSFDIAGWLKPPFALDFRVFDDAMEWFDAGWYLTHIPTGFGVGGIITNLPAAMVVADEIREIADWSFTDTDSAKAVAPAFVKFREGCPAKIVRGGPLAGPLTGMVTA